MGKTSTGAAAPTTAKAPVGIVGKRPAFQFYPNDWRTDPALRMCSIPARGLWIEMICIMHQGTPYGFLRINDRDLTAQMLATLAGAGISEVQAWLEELQDAGVFQRSESGSIFSKRMVRDEEIREKRASFGSLSQNNPNVPKKKDGAKDTPKDTIGGSLGGSLGGSPSSSSSSSSSSSVTKKKKTTTSASGDAACVLPITKTTWLTPYADVWLAEMGGTIPAGIAAKVLSALHKQHGEEKVAGHLKNYLRGTNASYVSLPKFASVFGQWSDVETAVRGSGKDCAVSDAEVERLCGEARRAANPWAD